MTDKTISINRYEPTVESTETIWVDNVERDSDDYLTVYGHNNKNQDVWFILTQDALNAIQAAATK